MTAVIRRFWLSCRAKEPFPKLVMASSDCCETAVLVMTEMTVFHGLGVFNQTKNNSRGAARRGSPG